MKKLFQWSIYEISIYAISTFISKRNTVLKLLYHIYEPPHISIPYTSLSFVREYTGMHSSDRSNMPRV